MSFGGHAYEAMKRTQDNRKLGKVRKIRFKDKEHYHKYRTYATIGKITKTEKEKQAARQKVQEEIKQQRKIQIIKFLLALIIGTWLGSKLYFTFTNSFQSFIYYH